MTLPERILRRLESIDADRALAIAKAAEAAVVREGPVLPPVEFVDVSPGKAMVFVGPCASLRRIPWLQLVETAPGRSMLIIPTGTAVESLEVAILDLLEKDPVVGEEERRLLWDLRGELGRLRRERRISKAEIIFFETRAPRPERATAGKRR